MFYLRPAQALTYFKNIDLLKPCKYMLVFGLFDFLRQYRQVFCKLVLQQN